MANWHYEKDGSQVMIRRSLFQSVVVIASVLFCCFPLGLFLVWKNPNWQASTKWKWTGATFAILCLLFAFGKFSETQTRKQLADANTRWEHGNKDAAISIYKQLTEYGPSSVPESERSIVYGRLIESDLEHGMDQSARKHAEKAISYGFEPSLNSAEAKSLVREIRDEQKRIQSPPPIQNANPTNKQQPATEGSRLKDEDRRFDKSELLKKQIYSASDLFLEFEANEVAANRNYKGKTILVDGIVHDIEAGGFMSAVTVNLRKHFDARGTRCVLTSAEGKSDTLRSLSAGSRVQIEGYCEGFTGVTVRLKNCKIIK